MSDPWGWPQNWDRDYIEDLEHENLYLRRLLKGWLREAGDISGTYYTLDSSWAYRMTEALFRKDKVK